MDIRATILSAALEKALLSNESNHLYLFFQILWFNVVFSLATYVLHETIFSSFLFFVLMIGVTVGGFYLLARLYTAHYIKKYSVGTLECAKMYLIIKTKNKETWVDENFKGEVIVRFKTFRAKGFVHNRIHKLVIRQSDKEITHFFVLEDTKKATIHAFLKSIDEMNLNYTEYTGGERTFYGKKLNYKEIQAFKRKRELRKTQNSST